MSDEDESETSASSEEPEQKTKGRKKKEDAGPKRPTSAFMYFSKERRPELKKANPGLSFGELGKLVGKEWKEASPSAKKPFEKQAEQDRARYADDKSKHADEGGAPKTKAKAKAKKSGPKGPRSAFMYFSQEKRVELKAANPSLSFAELGREVGKAWNASSESEKAKYQKLAVKDKARFEAEKEANPSEKKAPVKRKAKNEVSAEEEESTSGSEDAD